MSRSADVPAFAVAHDFRGAFQCAHLADARDNLPVPFDAEFEVRVWVDPAGINGELRHGI